MKHVRDKSEFSYFVWAIYPEGNRIESWNRRRSKRLGGEGFEPPTYWV